MKLAAIKPVSVNRNASTVAAYFNRQIEQNQLLPAQRRAVQRVNKRFFEVRRSIFSDDRLTRQDKAQLVSVLTFERMKAREAIQNPELHKEATYMGSAEIRGLVSPTPEEENPAFSISGPGASDPAPVRDSFKRLVKNLSLQVDDKTSKERERELSAKDIYTRKARFSQNVHYIDKKTDRTLFVDTGTSIALRRTGITEAGVSVALQLAQQRFGSTLTINGTAEFKHLVIEAAAKGGMDIHFTDKAMNDSLAARRTELEIEREGQAIEASTAPAPVTPTIEPAAAAPAPVTASNAPAVASPAAPAGPTESSFIVEREAEWRTIMKLTEADVLSSATVMQLRGEDHAMWLVASSDQTPAGMAMLTSYMENDSYRESFKSTIEDIYAKVASSPEAAQSLELAMTIAERIVNSVERQLSTAPPAAPAPIETVVDRKLIQGELIEHGPAPYQNKPTNGPSYFVTLKTETGNRTVWGTALEEVMQNEQFKPGENITLQDHGTVPVVIQVTGPDGAVTAKNAVRRDWTAESNTTRAALSSEVLATEGAAPITLTNSGEPIMVDPVNAADVAKYIGLPTNEVSVQQLRITNITKRLGMLENLRDNHSAGRGPEYIERCNMEIATAQGQIDESKRIIERAEMIPALLDRADAVTETLTVTAACASPARGRFLLKEFGAPP
jgi:hypothetical protein